VETDIPLKELTLTCAADLPDLLGSPGATVVDVGSLELPASAMRLDNLLWLRIAAGTLYRHLIEWQGYCDPRLLARTLYYRLQQDDPVAVTVVYLKPGDDTGDTLRQTLDGHDILVVPFRYVRLWEQDAAAAVASGRPGLAVLSPLMSGADRGLVEQAAAVVLTEEPDRVRQVNLLATLAIFAESFVEPEQLEALLGRERLMESKFLDYMMHEKTADLERRQWQQATKEVVAARFPEAPFALVASLEAIEDSDVLHELHRSLLAVADQMGAERVIREAAGG